MKTVLTIAVLATMVSTSCSAQWTPPPPGLAPHCKLVSTSKLDIDNCPYITVTNEGPKSCRLTIRYTHSGTTLGKRSSESHTLIESNFKPGSKDFEIHPGANCQLPNRLVIDEFKATMY